MKKHRITSIFSVSLIVMVCASLFAACQKIERIEENQVEKIVVWAQTADEHELSADDCARFIELYNASKYKSERTGEITAEPGTPEFGAVVYFRDGTNLRLNDYDGFAGRDFQVSLRNADGNEETQHYISSKELYTFVSKFAD